MTLLPGILLLALALCSAAGNRWTALLFTLSRRFYLAVAGFEPGRAYELTWAVLLALSGVCLVVRAVGV